jgi:lysine biosynthesis protein LysW
MATCPRCGADADYLPGELFSLVICDFCGDTIDVSDLVEPDDRPGTVRLLPAVAERPRTAPARQIA